MGGHRGFPRGGWIRDVILIQGIEINGRMEHVRVEDQAGTRIVECSPKEGIKGAIAKADDAMARYLASLLIQRGVLASEHPWTYTANYEAFWAQTMFPPQYE